MHPPLHPVSRLPARSPVLSFRSRPCPPVTRHRPRRAMVSQHGRPARTSSAEPRPTSLVADSSRVRSSTSFASAHVFPGGMLDPLHDGPVPSPDSPERHRDGPAYRLAAVRECFEETGILLAERDGALVSLPVQQRDEARRRIHAGHVRFDEWVASLGAVPDIDGLIPFTRWITPVGIPKRFTTQMYLYMLPLSRTRMPPEMFVPTPDNGVEHTAALFAPAPAWLRLVAEGSIILFPPQYYLLHLLSRFLTGTPNSLEEGAHIYTMQRNNLVSSLRRTPTAETEEGCRHPTSGIPWADKVMCPQHYLVRKADARAVLSLASPGPELDKTSRGGDWERVVLANLGNGSTTDLEVRRRVDVLVEEEHGMMQGPKL